ncbi:MAG: hypothetical protein ACLGHN_09030 [Bacteriovoracia bacterium]
MKVLGPLSLLFVLQFMSVEANAFSGHDQFKVESVKPKGEFGFRALGRGKHFTEMRFDCSKASEMGLVVTVVNTYGKTSHIVLPAGELGTDKYKCRKNLKQYFAGVYSKRGLASQNNGSELRTLELSIVRNGLFTHLPNKKTLSFK